MHTNEEIQRARSKYSDVNATFVDTCIEELKALLGLLILTASLKSNHLSTAEIFDSGLCGSRYKATMSLKRF